MRKILSVATLTLGLSIALSSSGIALADTELSNPDSLAAIFKEGTFKGNIRSLWYMRDFDGNKTDRDTVSLGGNLSYETASFHGISAGVGVRYAGEGYWQDDDKDTYPGMPSEDISALDQYYLRYKGFDTTITIGAQPITSPWMKGDWVRMNPKRYRGITIENKSIEKVELYGYYISDFMGWTDESFESVSSALGAEGTNDGAFVGGIVWRAPGSHKIQLWDYHYQDVANGIYLKTTSKFKPSNDTTLTVDLSYYDQNDVGDANAGELDTYQAGAEVTLKGYGASLTAFYSKTGDDALLDPFGGSRVIKTQGYLAGNNGDEDAYALKLGYDFSKLGVEGLEAYLFYGNFDWETDEMNNYNIDVIYKLNGWFKGVELRARYAWIDMDNGTDSSDIRFYFDWKF